MAKNQNNNTPAQQNRLNRAANGEGYWDKVRAADKRFCAKMEMIGGRFDI
jgi:hypothetical protein